MCKVSVLIPVYNTEKYLSKCLDSVIGQTLADIEIIITNDGSIDNSELIIEEYVKKDSRIKYSKQTNSGLGVTRNNGMKLAKGEYIAFLDSDDWVEKNCYEKMYNLAKSNDADLVISDYYVDTEKSSMKVTHRCTSQEEYTLDVITRKVAGFSWNKLYKRELIKSNNLSFPKRNELENVEDQYFSLRASILSNKVIFTNQSLIHYIIRESSIVNRYQETLIEDGIALYNKNLEFFCSHNIKNKFYEALNVSLINHICQSISNECKKDNKLSIIQRINRIRAIANIEEYTNVLDILSKKIEENDEFYIKSISKETLLYMRLLIRKKIITLYILKYLRIKYINFRTKSLK